MIPAFVNPLAGNAAAARAALDAVGGFDVRDAAPETLGALVRAAVASGTKRVLVAGGDGSIRTAAAALIGTNAELAIMPGGTLNHLARDLSLPADPGEAAALALHGRTAAIDAGAVNDQVFLNTSSVGAYSAFVRTRERLEHRVGYRLASFVAGLRILVRMPVFRVSLRVDGMERDYLTPLVFVGVGERELRVPALGARVSGGQRGLHVMVVRERSAARAVALSLSAAARGLDAVARTPSMDSFLVDECRVHARTHTVALDGELVHAAPPLDYQYLRACLRIVMPEARSV